MIRLKFDYSFPAMNLRILKENGDQELAFNFRCCWAVYDEDYRPVLSDDQVRTIRFTEQTDLRKENISGQIETELTPGTYIIGLRIEDLHSSRLGLYRKRFTAQTKGGVTEEMDEKQDEQ